MLHVSLETPEPLDRLMKDIVRLAEREASKVCCEVPVIARVELRGRDGTHAKLFGQPVAGLEISAARVELGREGVVLWDVDLGRVDQDVVRALRNGVGQLKLVKDLGQDGAFLEVGVDLVLEDGLLQRGLEASRNRLLAGRVDGEHDTGLSRKGVLDQMLRANEPADTPAGRGEALAARANGERALPQVAECSNAGEFVEWREVQAVILSGKK